MNLEQLAEKLNSYCKENHDDNFLAYVESGYLVILTTYPQTDRILPSCAGEKLTKFSEPLLTQYQKETGPEFVKVLWGRTHNFSWLIDDNRYVVDAKHYYF